VNLFPIALPALTEAAAEPPSGDVGNPATDFLQGLLPEAVPWWMLTLLGAGLAFAAVMLFVTVIAMFSVWLERKVAGHIQVRLGPMRVGGWHGWAQSIADGVKLLLKEDLAPEGSDKVLFKLAPMLVLATALATFVALPFAPGLVIADVDLGVFFILAVSSVTTIGVIMAGWGSNNKWSVYGAMREAAQVASYEIPLGLSLLPPILYFGSFSLVDASAQQAGIGAWAETSGQWFGMAWYILDPTRWLVSIPSFLIFFIALLAETKRAPFDLPESESELVAGFHTEYSGMRFSFFFLEEYAAMFVMGIVGVCFWFGGYSFPGITALEPGPLLTFLSILSFTVKGLLMVFVMMWVRWTLPRIRIDQVMSLGYKYLTPLALALVFVASLIEYFAFVIAG